MNRAKQNNATKEVNATDMFFTIPESLSHLVLHDTGTDDRNRIITLGKDNLMYHFLSISDHWLFH